MTSTADLLKQFYGIVDDADKEVPPDPTDINGNAFEPEPYYRKLVEKENLSSLVETDRKVKQEIKKIDSNLQSIVYDNYTKFLLAEQTISELSDGLPRLMTNMQNVLNSLKSVQKQSIEIQSDLKPNREKVQRLVGINRLLERIDFISQLPLKLRAYIDAGEYSSAVDIWLKAEQVLEKQTHYESFVKIKNECKEIIEEIREKAQSDIENPSTLSLVAINAALTLLKLQTPPEQAIKDLMKYRVLPELEKFEYDGVDKSDVFELFAKIGKEVVHSVTTFLTQYSRIIQPRLPKSEKHDDDIYVRGFKKTLFDRVCAAINMDQVSKMNSEDFSNYLNTFVEGLGPMFTTRQNERFKLKNLSVYVENKLKCIKDELFEMVLNADTNSDVYSTFNEILTTWKRSINLTMNDLDTLVRTTDGADQIVLEKTIKTIPSIYDEFQKIDPMYSLLAFGIQHQMSEHTVSHIFEQVARFHPTSPLLKMCTELCIEASKSAQQSLLMFIKQKRKMLSELIAHGMTTTSWLDARTPNDVSITTCLVIQDLILIWAQLKKIIGKVADGSMSSSHASAISTKSSRTGFSHFSSLSGNSSHTPLFHGLRDDNVVQIDRLFNNLNHLHLNATPEIDAKSVLSSITFYVLKTMLEYIRMDTFMCAGFNQMQVDAYFIYNTLCDKVENKALFNTIIEELISSAADRSIDPIPFKNVVLSEIYSRSTNKPAQKD